MEGVNTEKLSEFFVRNSKNTTTDRESEINKICILLGPEGPEEVPASPWAEATDTE